MPTAGACIWGTGAIASAAETYSPRPPTEGERWTADALVELRAADYRWAAWTRFLRASLVRSADARSEHPQLARQARLLGATGGAAWVLVCRRRGRGPLPWLLARRTGRTRLGRDLDSTADLAFLSVAAASAHADGKLPAFGAGTLAARHGVGVALALASVFGRARRPAIRARPLGGLLRFGGLALAAAGSRRSGTALLVAGCAIPPRSTAAALALA